MGARNGRGGLRRARALMLVMIVACGGTTSTTTAPPETTVAGATTTVAALLSTTTLVSPATTTTVDPRPIRTTFLQITEASGPGRVDISYPHLVHPNATVATNVNDQIDAAVQDLVDRFQATATADGEGESPSTLTIQAAPELLNENIFSISGVTADFYGGTGMGATGRLGWIFALDDGSMVKVTDLFIDNDLARLAESARAHLVADVLGQASLISTPDGLLPDPANFDAVWLTSSGIGVGFDQFQVASAEAGNPAVLIPFAELQDVISPIGILAPLQNGSTLPEL